MTAGSNPQASTAVCVVEYNPLAAAYLHRLLADDSRINLLSYDELIANGRPHPSPAPIFVLDRPTLPTALSKYLRTLRLNFPDARIIILDDPTPGEELCRLLFLGIQGFLAYEDVEAQLSPAIHAVAEGHLWVEPQVLELYVRFSTEATRGRDKELSLTRREKRILELVQRRLSNKEISTILDISESTVKFHVGNIFAKLGVDNRQAAAEAIDNRGLRTLLPYKAK